MGGAGSDDVWGVQWSQWIRKWSTSQVPPSVPHNLLSFDCVPGSTRLPLGLGASTITLCDLYGCLPLWCV